jgi:hypothetical protein
MWYVACVRTALKLFIDARKYIFAVTYDSHELLVAVDGKTGHICVVKRRL